MDEARIVFSEKGEWDQNSQRHSMAEIIQIGQDYFLREKPAQEHFDITCKAITREDVRDSDCGWNQVKVSGKWNLHQSTNTSR